MFILIKYIIFIDYCKYYHFNKIFIIYYKTKSIINLDINIYTQNIIYIISKENKINCNLVYNKQKLNIYLLFSLSLNLIYYIYYILI